MALAFHGFEFIYQPVGQNHVRFGALCRVQRIRGSAAVLWAHNVVGSRSWPH